MNKDLNSGTYSGTEVVHLTRRSCKDIELTVITDTIGTGGGDKIEELLDSDFGFTCITNESCDHRELEASFT